jgi:hypothetical protein
LRTRATDEKLHLSRRRASPWPAPAALRYWHLASLDAPTVAAVWSLAFAWVAGVRLAAWIIALQVLTVWTVYVGDRLLDARAGLRRPTRSRADDLSQQTAEDLRERHYFHWRHRRILVPAACIAAGAAACIAVRCMPIVVKERDSLLAAAAALYFTRVHAGRVRRLLRKELLVGILFAAGCALPSASPAIAVPAIFFAALAWLNCSAIEIWEGGKAGDERIVLAARLSAQPRSIAIGLACAGITIAAMLLPFTPHAAAMLAAGALSALLLAILDRARERMNVVAVRALADLVLLTPALLLAARCLPFRNIYR